MREYTMTEKIVAAMKQEVKDLKEYFKEHISDLHESQKQFSETQKQILAQTTRTNGRVTRLEKNSIGKWVSDHPLKFAGYSVIFIIIIISVPKDLIIEQIMSLFGC